jgi:hypothetical protein
LQRARGTRPGSSRRGGGLPRPSRVRPASSDSRSFRAWAAKPERRYGVRGSSASRWTDLRGEREMRCLHCPGNLALPRRKTRRECKALALRPCGVVRQCRVAKVDGEEAPEAAESAAPSPRIRQVAPDNQVSWGGPSSLFYKIEASSKHVLSVLTESRQAFLSCAEQQNAAVGAL